MEFLIKNIKLLDLENGNETDAQVGIENGKIACIAKPEEKVEAEKILDGDGAYLTPGWIDYHTHVFTKGSAFGVNADLLFGTGTTLAVDMGSTGTANFEGFRLTDMLTRSMPVKAYLNISAIGQPGAGISEPFDEKAVLEEKIGELLKKYPRDILGLKVRLSENIVNGAGIKPLERALELGEKFSLPICVHTTNPPVMASEIVKRLRPKDVYSHMYHGKGRTILDESKKVQKEFFEARKRGVYLEVGNGVANFDFPVAEVAMQQGLYPDIISSDATYRTFLNIPAMRDLAYVMSKFLNLGMPFCDVIKAVTKTPASCLKLEEKREKIEIGMSADLTMSRVIDKKVRFSDSAGNVREGERQIIPEATILNGRCMYLSSNLAFC